MFPPEMANETTKRAAPPAPGAASRPGVPVDPRRVTGAIRRGRRALVSVGLLAALGGGVLGKFVLSKTYVASATVLWEPPTATKTEAVRELATVAQSVKLPGNLLRVREVAKTHKTLEALGKAIDVTQGENSMLITVTAKESSRDDAAGLANVAVDVFLEAQHELAANRLREVVAALRQSLTEGEAARTRSHARYDAFRRENHVDDFSADVQASIAELARLRVSANDAQVELQGLQARESSLRQAKSDAPENVVLTQSETDAVATRLAQAETELAGLRAKYSDEHPMVAALAAEVASLKSKTRTKAVTAQTTGRSPTHETLTLQVEESSALRHAVEERGRALDKVRAEAEARASRLTSVQGEAARLLADVTADDEHVTLLVKQLTMAEDDVRGASSGFQVVSRATPPEHSEHGIGRIVAAGVPLLALIVTALALVWRELGKLRMKSPAEVAYWGRAPVLGSSPAVDAEGKAAAQLGRDLADALELRPGVVAVVGSDREEDADAVADMAAARLARRGRTCAVVHADELAAGHDDGSLADVLESRSFKQALAAQKDAHETVLLILPAHEPTAARAALRVVDGFAVVVSAATAQARGLATVRSELGLEGRGMAFVVKDVPVELYGSDRRKVGDAALLWRRPKARNRSRDPRPRPDGADSPARDSSRGLRLVGR